MSVTNRRMGGHYKSWLHDAAIKVKVNDDVENALNPARNCWNAGRRPPTQADAAQRKMLVAAAATMKDTSFTPEDRLAAATSEPVASCI